ncbi:methyl-accepting chemotaxis protein [Rhizobium sp. VS19-DR104.2]|uniref:methyl-accepting chemotaxis protein n=1 Tax=unclassified Rhizobium TaxID=2613769 RepID=UPI001C5AE09A|nr:MULTISPECIES: methyl-accepting chemotaxis protein [unclassified Rhizobium]MBZ5763070.1 methyl-accepting chemotaxis protein [Rhizobium sp. VS19-DR96]MBZ5768946.1 methyl-accepting chemotaxis protein [Rhizobium sp. VS19-DR129.2]MBZ5776564.1 methyl-accepting chemotaxis protein [Rhizobium sp. VS19-DRK62.2]MBZ5787697.1 methyl-accepting chemotaxis protein [Rhizobium sp. VS19-DR121]MBZ5805070.1 methyl-accepting chemotaxis protein [Rhizobium sp. VS19-DR181]
MKHVSIIGKFLIIMAGFGLFALGVSLYSGRQLSMVDAGYSSLLDRESAAALATARANQSLQAVRASVADLLMSNTDQLNAAAENAIKENQDGFVKYIDEVIAALPDRAEAPALKAEGLQLLTGKCAATITAARASTTPAEISASEQIFLNQCQPGFAEISPKITALGNSIADSASKESDRLTSVTNSTIMTTLTIVAVGLVAVLVLGFFAIRSWLVTPIQQLAKTMNVLASGDLTAAVDGADRRDEVGNMAKAVQVFKDNGLRAKELERDAESTRTASESERSRVAQADRQRAQEMAQATSGLADGLKHLSSGDLTFRLGEAFASDFESLRADFNAAVDQLASSMRSVSIATGSIDSGAREISRSADDLSKRTEQQAASLEETAAALDQITINVSNSSKRTEEARHVAIEANKSARRSGEVVSNTVIAMQRIEQSSNQISSIIGVIDEIAFQTNLLALNAGVEAARAGEAGKGFAVVAQEVRELAQRSAQAAKEIKDLIRNSGEEVSNGVKLVQETGQALKVIEEQVISINTQLDSIATSAKEQSVGLAEVNTAVNQMDQVTQQNAAMVEESTAASAALAGEVDRLREIIAEFNVAGARESTASRRPEVAHSHHKAVASPARRMLAKVAGAVGMGGASAAAAESWEEF